MVTAYRELDPDHDLTQRGDEVTLGGSWVGVPIVGVAPAPGLYGLRFRRPVSAWAPPLLTTHFLDQTAAVSSLESDSLRTILAKEGEHRAVVEQNNRGRDRAVDLGQEVRLLRDNFAARFRDRLFIVGERVIDTSDGKFAARGAEVVSE